MKWVEIGVNVCDITVRKYFYHLEYSDYRLHLHSYTHNVSVDAFFDLRQVFHSGLGNPHRTSKLEEISWMKLVLHTEKNSTDTQKEKNMSFKWAKEKELLYVDTFSILSPS